MNQTKTENSITANQEQKAIDQVEKKYGPRAWQQFDQIEQQAKLVFQSDYSHSEERKRPRRRLNRLQKKERLITQFETALNKHRKIWLKQYHNPFQQQKLELSIMPVLQTLENAFEMEYYMQDALKLVGLKSSTILFKNGARNNIGFILKYLKQRQIPKWIMRRHRQFMNKKYSQLKFDVNTILRSMSGNNSNCL